MPKRLEVLQQKTRAASEQVRDELERVTAQVSSRIEEMKKRLERRHDERVQLTVVGRSSR